MAIASTKTQKISYTIGQDEIIEAENKISSGDLVYKINGIEEFIPGQTNLGNKILLDVNDQVSKDGFYTLNLDKNKISDLSFNYDRKESNMMVTTSNLMDELAESSSVKLLDGSLKAEFSSYINEKDKGIVLWWWCLILALVFLAIETLLLRVWSEK